MDQEETARFWW